MMINTAYNGVISNPNVAGEIETYVSDFFLMVKRKVDIIEKDPVLRYHTYSVHLAQSPDGVGSDLPIFALRNLSGEESEGLIDFVGMEIGKIMYSWFPDRWHLNDFYPVGEIGDDFWVHLRRKGIATVIETEVAIDMYKRFGDIYYTTAPTWFRKKMCSGQGRDPFEEHISDAIEALVFHQMRKKLTHVHARSQLGSILIEA